MSESATEKHLIDPDDWFLTEDDKDVIWFEEDIYKALSEDLENKFLDNVYLCGGPMK